MSSKYLLATFLLLSVVVSAGAQSIKKRLEAVDDYIIQEDYASAEKLLVRILRSDEGVHEAHYKLALVRSLKGDYKQALPEASKATKLKPEEPNYCALLGKVWLALDEDEKGFEWLQRALLQDSMLPEALLSRAQYLAGRDSWDLALADYLKLNQVVIDEPVLYYRVGECHFEMGSYKKAEEWLVKTVNANPIDMDARWLLALTSYELAKFDQGLFQVDQLIKMEGSTPEYDYQKGQFHRGLFQLEDARKAYQSAIKSDKENLNYVFGLIMVEELSRNYVEATVLTDQLIALYPAMRPLLVLKGRILAKRRDIKGARRYLNLAIDGMEGRDLPFVNDVKVYLGLLNYLKEDKKARTYLVSCDNLYIYHWCFYQLKDRTGLSDCEENLFKEYFSSPSIDPLAEPKQQLLAALGFLKKQEIEQSKKILESVRSVVNYELIDYHLSEILLQHLP